MIMLSNELTHGHPMDAKGKLRKIASTFIGEFPDLSSGLM